MEEENKFEDLFLAICGYTLATAGTFALGSVLIYIGVVCIIETLNLLR